MEHTKSRGIKTTETTLTSKIRVFIMLYYKSAATEQDHLEAGHGSFEKPSIGNKNAKIERVCNTKTRQTKTLRTAGLWGENSLCVFNQRLNGGGSRI